MYFKGPDVYALQQADRHVNMIRIYLVFSSRCDNFVKSVNSISCYTRHKTDSGFSSKIAVAAAVKMQ